MPRDHQKTLINIVTRRSGSAGTAANSDDVTLPLDDSRLGALREAVGRRMAGLPERDQRVLKMRFGIGMPSARTLASVGEQYGITRERVRQIEAAALRRMMGAGGD